MIFEDGLLMGNQKAEVSNLGHPFSHATFNLFSCRHDTHFFLKRTYFRGNDDYSRSNFSGQRLNFNPNHWSNTGQSNFRNPLNGNQARGNSFQSANQPRFANQSNSQLNMNPFYDNRNGNSRNPVPNDDDNESAKMVQQAPEELVVSGNSEMQEMENLRSSCLNC